MQAFMRRLIIGLVAVACAVGLVGLTAPNASAAVPRVVRVVNVTSQYQIIYVYSPAMNKVIPNDVLRPKGRPANAPNFYLLHGVGGNVDKIGWVHSSHYRQFFANKRVNVISPTGGARSLYTDWWLPDPIYGINKWQTYINYELPRALKGTLHDNGVKAIGGVSMSGGSAIDLAMHAPGQYRAAASYSGCPAVSSPIGAAFTNTEIFMGLGIPTSMWGPYPSPAWFDHDPGVNPHRLGKTKVYMSVAPGIPGAIDKLPGSPPINLGVQLEQTMSACTQITVDAFRRAHQNLTFKRFPKGTHSWGVFEAGLRDSWRVVGPAIGA